MSSIYLAKEMKERLLRGARRRGFKVERGPNSQLQEYVAYLLSLDEKAAPGPSSSSTLNEALGLLAERGAPSDQEVDDLLRERRLNH